MTATEELRRMLDEAGVEWEDMSLRPYACTSWCDPDGEPCTALEGADDIPDGKLSVQALLTPEQAIAATLGSCNCSNNCANGERTNGACIPVLDSERDGMPYLNPRFVCSECGCQLTESRLGKVWQNFCPNCGRRIVDPTTNDVDAEVEQ